MPQSAPPFAVQDLRAEIQAGALQLSWELPTADRQPPDSYVVYCWQRPVEDAPCNGCPPQYEKIGQVSGPPQAPAGNGRMTFGIPLEPGYRYTCRVVCRAVNGSTGAPSNEVTVSN
jgi:hypothetical protein